MHLRFWICVCMYMHKHELIGYLYLSPFLILVKLKKTRLPQKDIFLFILEAKQKKQTKTQNADTVMKRLSFSKTLGKTMSLATYPDEKGMGPNPLESERFFPLTKIGLR